MSGGFDLFVAPDVWTGPEHAVKHQTKREVDPSGVIVRVTCLCGDSIATDGIGTFLTWDETVSAFMKRHSSIRRSFCLAER